MIYEIQIEIETALENYLECFNEDWELIVSEEEYAKIESELQELQNKKSDYMEWLMKTRANRLASIQGIDSEIERLVKMKESIQKKVDKTDRFIDKLVSKDYNGKTINYWLFSVGYRKSKATVIDNEELIPTEYKKEKVSVSIDKTLIKKDIEAGKFIEWARIEERMNLFIK